MAKKNEKIIAILSLDDSLESFLDNVVYGDTYKKLISTSNTERGNRKIPLSKVQYEYMRKFSNDNSLKYAIDKALKVFNKYTISETKEFLNYLKIAYDKAAEYSGHVIDFTNYIDWLEKNLKIRFKKLNKKASAQKLKNNIDRLINLCNSSQFNMAFLLCVD